jgi:glycosyltransferase involved in cell wall biosynthesis
MKIAIDASPLVSANKLAHRVRGVGFYTEHLVSALRSYFPEQTIVTFITRDEIPRDADIVHYPYFEPFFLSLPPKKLHKTVVTVHDLIPLIFAKQFPAGFRGKIRWFIQRKRLLAVDHVITDSLSSKQDIQRFVALPEKKISVIYLAAAESFVSKERKEDLERIKQKYELPQQFALYVGDVTWNKNLPRLIRALRNTSIPLVLVGKALKNNLFDRNNPWNRDLLEVEKLTKESPNVMRLGFVSTADLASLYQAATVFVMPSLYEGFGLPVIEAMQCSCPVVTSLRGALREVVGDAAYIVDPEDEQSIREGVKKVFYSQSLQKSLIEKGLKQVTKFSWKHTAEGTMSVYKKVLGI